MGNCCVKKSARYLFSNGFYDGSFRELVLGGESNKTSWNDALMEHTVLPLVLNYLLWILEPNFAMITLNSWIMSYKCVCSSKMTWTPQQKVFCSTFNIASKYFKFVTKKFEIKFKIRVSPSKSAKKCSIQLFNASMANFGSKISKKIV